MNNDNFNNISLIDTGLYNNKYSFSEIFQKNNITTLGQVLDDETMNNLISKITSSKVKEQLIGYISLLKNKYLGDDLSSDKYLVRRASKIEGYNSKFYKSNVDYFYKDVNFNAMGFNSSSHLIIMLCFAKNLGKFLDGIELIDFFRLLYGKSADKSLNNTLSIFINHYNTRNNFNDIDVYNDEIKFFKEKIAKYEIIINDLEDIIFNLNRKVNRLRSDVYADKIENSHKIKKINDDIKFLFEELQAFRDLNDELIYRKVISESKVNAAHNNSLTKKK